MVDFNVVFLLKFVNKKSVLRHSSDYFFLPEDFFWAGTFLDGVAGFAGLTGFFEELFLAICPPMKNINMVDIILARNISEIKEIVFFLFSLKCKYF